MGTRGPCPFQGSRSRLERYVENAVEKHSRSRRQRPVETTLESHDVAFPLPAREHGSPTMFRILLLPTSGANTPEAAARIDRLSMLDGNGKAAVILLFADSDDTASFMELQMRFVKTPYLSHGGNACGYADQVL